MSLFLRGVWTEVEGSGAVGLFVVGETAEVVADDAVALAGHGFRGQGGR